MKLLCCILCATALFLCAFDLKAETVSDSTFVQFKQSKTDLLLDFNDNGANLSRMLSRLQEYNDSDSIYVLRSIRVVGAASPEGSVSFNKMLSERRAQAIFDYFAQRVYFPDSIAEFAFKGRDWHGLYLMVQADPNVPSRAKVLDVISSASMPVQIGPAESDAMLRRLKTLDGGHTYLYIYHKLFPTLRRSRLFVTYDHILNPAIAVPKDTVVPVDTVAIIEPEPVIIVEPEPAIVLPPSPFYMGIKTNMLYDAAAIPNIGAEFYLGKNMSIVANWSYAWWKSDKRHRYWRSYGGDLALRWWFGRAAHEKPLTGHHLGLYGGAFTYDFEWGGKGYMGGRPGHSLWDRCMANAGVEYGYSLPVAKRLNIDFTIGFGYIGGKLVKYEPQNSHYVWLSTSHIHWLGPTKAEVSLVWLIGRGNVNKRKEATR